MTRVPFVLFPDVQQIAVLRDVGRAHGRHVFPKFITPPWNRANPPCVESRMRYRTLLFAAPGLAMLLTLAACGDEQANGNPAEAPSGTTSVQPSGTPAESPTIKVKASAEAPAKTWTLTCDPLAVPIRRPPTHARP